MTEPLLIERRDNLALLTLNRPEAMNALNSKLRLLLTETVDGLGRDDSVRAVVITGAGDRAFSAGLDIKEARGVPLEEREEKSREMVAVYRQIRALDKPVISAINGVAVGAGFQIGLASDVRIGHPEVRMGQPEINAGLASIMGSYLMTLHLGLSRNLELSLTGRLMDAAECKDLGLLNHVVPRENLLSKAMEMAGELAAKPPLAMQLTKRWFREFTAADFEAAGAGSVAAQKAAFEAGEAQRVMEAFVAKRGKPQSS